MAKTTVDKEAGVVIKEGLNNMYTRLFNGFQREIEWLIKLRHVDRVPKILEVQYPNKLALAYIGETITKETIPIDWYEQIIYILGELKKYKCHHNDIKPNEILVANGKLYLIDYNWATEDGEKMPDHPITQIGLGCQYKRGLIFDDEYSFITAILTVLRNDVFPEELKKIDGRLDKKLIKQMYNI